MDLGASVTLACPGKIDHRIHADLMAWLRTRAAHVVEDLDFRQAVVRDGRVYLDDRCLSDLDAFVWFGEIDRRPGSHHLEILRTLEMCTRVINSHAYVSVGLDKFRAFSRLHLHGVPVSEFALVDADNIEQVDLSAIGPSVLLKPRRGGFGKGIVKIDSADLLRDVVDYIAGTGGQSVYLERFYENDMSRWTGLTVIDGEVLYGYRKRAEKIAGFKPYDRHRIGGGVDRVPVDAEHARIARSIYDILKPDFFGLDIIATPDGDRVVDINCFPGLYADFLTELDCHLPPRFFGMLDLAPA